MLIENETICYNLELSDGQLLPLYFLHLISIAHIFEDTILDSACSPYHAANTSYNNAG